MDRSLDISHTKNDLIYQLIDYYLEEVSKNPPSNVVESISDTVNLIMNYYFLARKNGVIDIDESRRLLDIKIRSDGKGMNLLEESTKLCNDFDELTKNTVDLPLIEKMDNELINQQQINENITSEITIDEKLKNMELRLKEDLCRMFDNVSKDKLMNDTFVDLSEKELEQPRKYYFIVFTKIACGLIVTCTVYLFYNIYHK